MCRIPDRDERIPFCVACMGQGWRDGVEPPMTDHPLHAHGECKCFGEMSPECPFCKHICPVCLGDGGA
jgi:hypothetical protein